MAEIAFETPVLFLAYKRPDLATQVFAQIAKLKPAKLYVAIDGAKNATEKKQVNQVQTIVKQIDWPCKVKYLFRQQNLGCRLAISQAISWFFEHEEAGIILEDDCLPNQDFFYFCQRMLRDYQDDERVMMITGTNYLLKHPQITSDYFFSRHSIVWGWATWKRAWRNYDLDLTAWPHFRKTQQLKQLKHSYFGRKYLEISFDLIREQLVDTWDIQWAFACLFNSGLCIVPRVNLVSNIGVDGTHASRVTNAHFYPVFALDAQSLKAPQYVTPDYYFDHCLDRDKSAETFLRMFFYRTLRRLPFYRLIKKFRKSYLS